MSASKDEFLAGLKDKRLSDLDVVQRYITFGGPFVFHEEPGRYFDLKKEIGDHFKLNPENVIMVGSAKLGFSISPNKLWKPFDGESDIDMVIVSDGVFDLYWQDLYDFDIELTDRTASDDKNFKQFLKCFFKGWIRPDLFPFKYPNKNAWFDFFKSISHGKYGPQKITGAIFRNMTFFENYHRVNIRQIRLEVN